MDFANSRGIVVKIRIQFCMVGSDRFCWRALVCGGLRIPAESSTWDRKTASRMLDLLEIELPGVDRSKIRFVHV